MTEPLKYQGLYSPKTSRSKNNGHENKSWEYTGGKEKGLWQSDVDNPKEREYCDECKHQCVGDTDNIKNNGCISIVPCR